MVHGTVKGLFRLISVLGMAFLLFAALLGHRLSQGPLTLSFLTPFIEDALKSPNGGSAVKLDATVLAWSDETRSIEIRALGVRVLAGEMVIAVLPEMSLSLSAPALIQGVIAPRSLRLMHPHLRLQRDAQGSFHLGMGEPIVLGGGVGGSGQSPGMESGADVSAMDDFLLELLTPPGGDSAASQLRRILVVDGDLMIEDQASGKQWHAPHADVDLQRGREEISGHAKLGLDIAGEPAWIDAKGRYRLKQKAVEVNLDYGGLRPSIFASLSSHLADLSALQLPTGGSIDFRWELEHGLSSLRFELSGGAGQIDAVKWIGKTLPVSSVGLRGTVGPGFDTIILDEFRVDLGGPVASLLGRADHVLGAMELDLTARVEALPVDTLKGLWPASVARNPRTWVTANMSKGQVRQTTARLLAHVPAGKTVDDLVVDQLAGDMALDGTDVQYLAPMPVVHNCSAVANFDANVFTITIKGGDVMGLHVLPDSKVVLAGLSAADQTADIAVKIGGPVSDVLQLIDSKPLGYASALGVQPAKVKGESVTILEMHFPLIAKLTFDEMKIHAQAQTKGLALPNVALGLDLTEGVLGLDVDPKGMDVSGKAKLGGLSADIKWHEAFNKNAIPRSRYSVQTTLDDAGRKLVGLDVAPFQAPFMTGSVPVDVTALLWDGGRGDIEVRANLTPTTITLPGLHWSKKPAAAGAAVAQIKLVGGRLADIPRFALSSPTDALEVQGRVTFENGQPRRVTFERAKWGKTDVQGVLTLKGGTAGLAVEASGPSFDAREMLESKPEDRKKDKEEVVPLTVSAKVDQVWVSDTGKVSAVSAAMARDNHNWIRMRIDAEVGDEEPLHLELAAQPGNKRGLVASSTDAGAVFRTFDVFDNMVGGKLSVDAYYDDNSPRQPLKGTVTVADYQVMKAPAVARLLTVAALTGIGDVLLGKGIQFNTLDAPFTLTDGVLELHDARASGTELGITAKGQVDLDYERLALEGTIVPAYAINSVLGKIPLIGDLFSNEKGGGIIAMNYSMNGPSKDPDVRVNPLSALTPGFLRKLFNVFDDGSETDVRLSPKKLGPVVPSPLRVPGK